MNAAIVFAGVAPHPPLLIPEVGAERISRVENSRRSLVEFSKRLLETAPETVVVISPHSPLDPGAFTTRSTAQLQGDFRDFSAPEVRLAFDNDLEFIEAAERTAARAGLRIARLPYDHPLDHGAMVPLYYLHQAGWRGPVVVFGFTMQDNRTQMQFGLAIERAATATGRRIALVASGDLSHRLIVGGPYAYEPTAHLFDEQIVNAVATGQPSLVDGIDQSLRIRAGECGYRSILVAIGALDSNLRDHEVLSYEGPFGVGYMVAILFDEGRLRA